MRKPLAVKDLSYFCLILMLLAGCAHLVMDPSVSAVEAGDYTLATSACEAVPGRGMDVCHVREGSRIESKWTLVVPSGRGVLGGEVNVYYRDIQRSYAVTGPVLEIPWKEFFGKENWDRSMDGEALALVTVRLQTPEGDEVMANYRGIAKLVVTKQGYDRLPIDSGYARVKLNCKVQYSSAGRGAVECR